MRIITNASLFFVLIAMTSCEDRLESSSKELKALYCLDRGVYHVSPADRFGTAVIVVQCISKRDKVRIEKMIGERFKDFPIYYMAPIWSVGELLSVHGKRILEIEADGSYAVSGSEARKKLGEQYDLAEKEEAAYWDSLPESEQTKIIREVIIKRREIDERFANCGDKYLHSP